MLFKNNEEKLKHIGLMCCSNLHDAFANLSRILSLCNNNNLTEQDRFEKIKEIANKTYDIFRAIESYRNQTEKAIVKTFMVGDLCDKIKKFWSSTRDIELNLEKNFELTCQESSLLRILLNLIDNCYIHNKFKVKVKITVQHNKIIVSDDGIGISDEIKDKIFDLFFTTKDLDKLSGVNNGIGLYGVKQLIDKLGYKIYVENDTIL